jgi:hypothetical protein
MNPKTLLLSLEYALTNSTTEQDADELREAIAVLKREQRSLARNVPYSLKT